MAADNLPEEFTVPVDYSGWWFWIALLALLLVIAYYVLVLYRTRKPQDRQTSAQTPRTPVTHPQTTHMQQIADIEQRVRSQQVDLREAYQQLSETVRSYVDVVTPLPAAKMSLADIKAAAPGELANTIELMYIPEFAPEAQIQDPVRFEAALHYARNLVSTWR